MGISKDAFNKSGGFGKIHPGEDPDLSIRLNDMGFTTGLYIDVKVFHKRRISVASFFKQVYKFGVARSILNLWHKKTKKIIYWFPALFSLTLSWISPIAIAIAQTTLNPITPPPTKRIAPAPIITTPFLIAFAS